MAMLSNVGDAEDETALDIVVADIRDRSSLTPSLFEVSHTTSCYAGILGTYSVELRDGCHIASSWPCD